LATYIKWKGKVSIYCQDRGEVEKGVVHQGIPTDLVITVVTSYGEVRIEKTMIVFDLVIPALLISIETSFLGS
jgi:hypothetical protein